MSVARDEARLTAALLIELMIVMAADETRDDERQTSEPVVVVHQPVADAA